MHELSTVSWDDLRVLLAVLREGSFTRAASRLGVEQSTISRRIAALEATLERPLFERDRRGPVATDLGERLRTHAERVEREVHALLDVADKHERAAEGRVRLACTEALAVQVLIPSWLPAMRAKHPRLYIDLVTSDDAADLSAREAEIALRFFRPNRGDLRAQKVSTMQVAPVASKRYRVGKRAARELDWIVYDHGHRRTPEAEWFDAHVGTAPALRTNGYIACVEAVRAGLGVALLAEGVCAWDPSLRPLTIDVGPLPALDLWLVAPSGLRGVPRVDAVWDALAEHMGTLDRALARGSRAKRRP